MNGPLVLIQTSTKLEEDLQNESAWKAGHQKELAQLLADIRSGKRRYDVVLVWALDRLSREGALRILQLVDSLEKLNCRVVSAQEPWTEVDGSLNDVLYSLVGWVAQFESARKSERTKAGLERALKEGKKLGRPKGSKDRKKRRRSGYFLRYAEGKQKVVQNERTFLVLMRSIKRISNY